LTLQLAIRKEFLRRGRAEPGVAGVTIGDEKTVKVSEEERCA
jgi:hypothetical protein